MLNLYDLIPSSEGFQFLNQAQDLYNVYLTTYSLLDPDKPESLNYIEVYMLGFSCKRFNSLKAATFDKRTKDTILYIFDGFLKQYSDDAFVYICGNSDGRARNRRITFGGWFNESNTVYEQHHFHIKNLDTGWYSTLIFNRSNNYKNIFIDAYHFTINQLLSEG